MIEINKNKRVEINEDGKVIISNDNALIGEHGTHTDITGNYAIDDISVLRLITALNGTHTIKETYLSCGHRFLSIFTNDKDLNAKFEELKNIIEGEVQNNDAYKSKIKDLGVRIVSLENQIEQFNSTRHWWERKLKIKE